MNFCFDYSLYNLYIPLYHEFLPATSRIPLTQSPQITIQTKQVVNELAHKKTEEVSHRSNQIAYKTEFLEPISLNSSKKIITDQKKNQTDSFTEKRNIVPNNINHILAFVQRKSKSESIVNKAIRKYGANSRFTSKRFYCYQAHLKEKLYVHVNKSTLCTVINHLNLHSDLFNVEEQLFYNKICRILINYYLRQKGMLVILSSQRVKQTSKTDHLRAQRSLLKFINGVDNLQ